MTKNDDFDWGAEQESVVVKSQDAIAVYLNPDKDMVIRRERAWNDDDDTFIVIGRAHVRRIIEAMERLLREATTGGD